MGYISAQQTRYSHLISGFFILAILLVSAGSADAGTVINLCNDCHGMPPKDGTRKSNPHFRSHSSATVGSHQKHLAAAPVPNDCVVCHGPIVSAFDHQNDVINMAAPISGGSYGKGVFFNMTSIPVLGTTAKCSNVSCHADPYSAGTVTTPIWGTSAGCAACHTTPIGTNGPATGSHTTATGHAVACTTCHAAGTTATTAPSAANGHNDGNIDIFNVGYATLNKTKGTAGVSCSTAICHGSTSPAWGANTANDTCTKCHGTGTVTVTVANRAVIAPSDAAGVGTGKVSANAKIGAHETHLTFLNGLSAQGTQDSRCNDCHGALPTSGSHANGSSTPAFQGLATHNGTMTGASFSAGSCSNTYCHNPAGTGGTLNSANAGTGINPAWTNAAYIADGTLKTQANCGMCHKVPGDAGFTFASAHGSMVTNNLPANNCIGCHGHEGGTGGIAGQQHIDGIRYAAGNCDSCHGYQAGSWAAAPVINAEGKGAHESHIVYLTTKRFGTTITLTPTSDQYASAATTWTNVCGICHDNTLASHRNGTVNVAINASQAYVFGPAGTVATYNGLPGRLAANDKTCSNISCHYFTTPVWSTY